MRVTIKEIAERAGVHRSTVDKVLHGRPGVSTPVRQRVQRLLDESGYRPNPAGRALQKQAETFRIAAVVLAVDSLDMLRSGMADGLEKFDNFRVELTTQVVRFPDAQRMAALIDRARQEQVHGILLQPINAESVRRAVCRAQDAGIPVVTTNAMLEGCDTLCYVGQDGRRESRIAARLMGEFLRGQGEIALVVGSVGRESEACFINARCQYFSEYLAERFPGVKIAASIETLEDCEVIGRKTEQLLREHPQLDGIYVACSGAAEVGRCVAKIGRAGQIKVIGHERYPQMVEQLKLGNVTCSLDSDIPRQGRLPVEILMEFLLYGTVPNKQYDTGIGITFPECLE